MRIVMPPAETEEFLKLIGRATVYLEYGTGGSTFAASQSASIKTIISVESDAKFIREVVEAIPDGGPALHAIHADIGPTKQWGHPSQPGANFSKFPNYVMAPWNACEEQQVQPDLVLIDGRFRVASCLYSMLNAQSGTLVFFDDYMDRPHYHCVSDVLKPIKVVGRSATFRVSRRLNRLLAVRHLTEKVVDSR